MRRRLATVVWTTAFGLLIPLGSALADGLPDTGSYSYFSIDTDQCDEFANCVRGGLQLSVKDGVVETLCMQLSTSVFGDQNFLGHGCTNPGGALAVSNKFIVGIGSTTFAMYDNSDQFLANVIVSSTNTIVGPIVRSASREPWPGPCGGTWTGRSQTVDLAGSITIDGLTYPDTGISSNLEAKVRARC